MQIKNYGNTGYVLTVMVGISLGLIGSGGSILSVPILVYIMGVNPVMATAYSLFIVGSTALVDGVQNSIQKRVDFKTVLIYGIPSIAAVYATRMWLVPFILLKLVYQEEFTTRKEAVLRNKYFISSAGRRFLKNKLVL